LEITFLGHSAFRLRGKEVTVVTDPYPPEIGFPLARLSADLVTISHNSPNHSYVKGVANDPKVVSGPGEYEIAGVLIAGVATALEPKKGPVNTAYVMRFEDVTVCHLGDLRGPLHDNQVEELGNIDILLLPVGGGKALGPSAAAEVVAQLSPAVIIPMHYRVDGSTVDSLTSVDAFCREMGAKDWSPELKLTVSRSSLPSEPRVAVLEQRRG
jgi:L-ascorbate metabolism protein UlaG (beta-lactamase superfamily)